MDDEQILQSVKKHGWHAIVVGEANPPFAYSVGLISSYQHPEIIVFGLDAQELYVVLRSFAEQIAHGRSFKEPENYRPVLHGAPCLLARVHHSHHEMYLEYALAHCGRTGTHLEAIQCFWPDEQGAFPTDTNCDPHTSECQPRLDQEALQDFLGIKSWKN